MSFNIYSSFLIAVVPLLSLFVGCNAATNSSLSYLNATSTTASDATVTFLSLTTPSASLDTSREFVPPTDSSSPSSQLNLLNATQIASMSSTKAWLPPSNSTKKTSIPVQEATSTIGSANPSATTTLLPAVHWDHDTTDLSHIDPQPSARFYYAEQPGAMDPNAGGQFAHVTTNFTYPTVILEHSAFIDKVTCGPSKADVSIIELAISFSAPEAYQSAKSNWALHADLVLITYIKGCGVSDQDQRAFWKTITLDLDDKNLNIHATAKEIPLQETVKEMDLEWGSYEPAKPNSTFFVVTNQDGEVSASCEMLTDKVVDGFPTAPCGPEFDKLLDDFLGYVDGTSLDSRSLNKRCHFWQVACLAREAWEAAQRLLKKLDPHWDPSISKTFGFNLGPSGLVSTPFGQAHQLFRYSKDPQEYIAAYCVNCGVQGSVTLYGKASLALLEGIRSAEVGMNGHVSAGLYFGIDAQGSYGPSPYSQTLGSVGIPGLSVPGIYSIGPMVSIGVELSVNVNAGGQVLLGASMDWPAFAVTLDLVHGRNTHSSGLTPQITSKFLAAGHISATAGIGCPIAFGIGLDIPVINFHKALEIVDKPGLQATLTYSTGTSPVTGLTDSCNNGISSSMYFTNDVYISAFDITRWNIWNYKSGAFARLCHKFRRNALDVLDTIEAPSRFSRRAKRDTNSSSSVLAPPDTTYTTIVDVDLKYQLMASPDGNLYLTTPNSPASVKGTTLFALSENGTAVLSDSSSSVFHYYPNTLSKYGVSRFRVSSATSIPKTASLAALVIAGDADGRFNGKSVFVVVTAEGTLGYPALCTYRDTKQLSKIFMVRDLDEDLQVFQKKELQNTVTGGEIDKCVFLPLTLGIGAPAS